MNKIQVERPKYHLETGVELGPGDCFEFDVKRDHHIIKSLLTDKELLLDTNFNLKNKLEKLAQENLSLERKLEEANKKNEQFMKYKAIKDMLGLNKKRVKAYSRILTAISSDIGYINIDRDLEFLEKTKIA